MMNFRNVFPYKGMKRVGNGRGGRERVGKKEGSA